MPSRWDVEHAVLRSNLEPSARLIMLVLAVKADNQTAVVPAEFSPSLVALCELTGLAKSSVAVHLNFLEDFGWVKRGRVSGGGRSRRTSYSLFPGSDRVVDGVGKGPAGGPFKRERVRQADRLSEKGSGRRTAREQGKHGNSPGVGPFMTKNSPAGGPLTVRESDRFEDENSPAGGPLPITTKRSTTKSTTSGEDAAALFDTPTPEPPPTGPSEPATTGKPGRKKAAKKPPKGELKDTPEFLEFYAAYPRREAPIRARKAWETAIARAPAEQIIAGARRFAATCARNQTEKRFTALPATWLNDGRWADEEEEQKPRHFGYRNPSDPNAYKDFEEGYEDLP